MYLLFLYTGQHSHHYTHSMPKYPWVEAEVRQQDPEDLVMQVEPFVCELSLQHIVRLKPYEKKQNYC